jgi:hypothetical protein
MTLAAPTSATAILFPGLFNLVYQVSRYLVYSWFYPTNFAVS